MAPMNSNELAHEVVEKAKRAGASAAEATVRFGTEFSTSVRLGEVEKLLQSSFRKLGLRVFCGTRSAIMSTSDFSSATLDGVAADAVELARAASDDPAAGLPEPSAYGSPPPGLDLFFPRAAGLSAREKIELARRCEDAAFAYDTRISNSEGAGFSESVIHTSYANSLGIDSSYSRTLTSLFTTPLAETNGQKQRDYWLSTHPDPDRLQSPEDVGREAARRTLRRLGARKVDTCEVPVVFDPLAAATLMKHAADAVSGTALLRKASFLLNRLGTEVASPLVTLVDDPLLSGGLGSRPFDAEGIPSQTTCIIRNGVLESYLLDSYAARKLGLRSTANSNRELHGGPSVGPSNFFLKPGTLSPDEIIGSVDRGLYVTELIGFGVDIVSGNYSQGAAGLWIEKGAPTFPVEEITVAGNLKEMLTRIEAVGNDPWILGEIFAPTLLIGKMVVSGN
jgi:PmbA protein